MYSIILCWSSTERALLWAWVLSPREILGFGKGPVFAVACRMARHS